MNNNFIEVKYFLKSEKISITDFHNEEKNVIINGKYILSLSELQEFVPLFAVRDKQTIKTKPEVNEYALLTMINNDKYYLKKESFEYLYNII